MKTLPRIDQTECNVRYWSPNGVEVSAARDMSLLSHRLLQLSSALLFPQVYYINKQEHWVSNAPLFFSRLPPN